MDQEWESGAGTTYYSPNTNVSRSGCSGVTYVLRLGLEPSSLMAPEVDGPAVCVLAEADGIDDEVRGSVNPVLIAEKAGSNVKDNVTGWRKAFPEIRRQAHVSEWLKITLAGKNIVQRWSLRDLSRYRNRTDKSWSWTRLSMLATWIQSQYLILYLYFEGCDNLTTSKGLGSDRGTVRTNQLNFYQKFGFKFIWDGESSLYGAGG
ncbi:hypothetical protein C8R44DRAFT_753108 [Mycena epipterygia]|nr:hypothetical protein C8R44DRAFT_753108 [Mycena epipterygia]